MSVAALRTALGDGTVRFRTGRARPLRRGVARAGRLVALVALFLPSLASGAEWRIADFMPNPAASAEGVLRQTTVHGPDGARMERVRYHLYSWSAGRGLFYQTVDEPGEGPICASGVPFGAHAGYGRAGAGYDWYAVEPEGHFYLGWQYFAPDCTFTVGVVLDPFAPNRRVFPAVVDDRDGAHFALQVPTASSTFTSSGELIAHDPPLEGAVSRVTMWLDGTQLAWQLDDPDGWRYTIWLDRPTAGIARTRLERGGVIVEERTAGQWVLP